jgi:hypothetical protein
MDGLAIGRIYLIVCTEFELEKSALREAGQCIPTGQTSDVPTYASDDDEVLGVSPALERSQVSPSLILVGLARVELLFFIL